MGLLPVPTKRAARFLFVSLLILVAAAIPLALYLRQPAVPRTSGAFPHEAYVWQRSWNDPVREGINQAAPSLSGLVALAAEVSWDGGLRTVRVRPDYDTLREVGVPVGLALRIGPFSGKKHDFEKRAAFLAELAASLLSEAKAAGVRAKELQIDFDCSESKLDSFRVWVQAIKASCAPVPVTITALPCWLNRRAFRRLVGDADGYVLQVHSLEPPQGPDEPFTLCDTAAGRRWIEQAARMGVPFKVALPTYGYLVAFDGSDNFIGLAAEGAGTEWSPGNIVTTVESDPREIAALVRELCQNRPANMLGVVWYRLPVEGDQLNWHWKTLLAVMEGREPAGELRAEVERPEPRLVDVYLANRGEKYLRPEAAVRLGWHEGSLLASDGLSGFEFTDDTSSSALCRAGPRVGFARIAPGERRQIAWLRFEQPTEVKGNVEKLQN